MKSYKDLDELIWKGFEKITQKAHKELGWNKFDLARITHSAATFSGAAYGVYGFILQTKTNNYFYLVQDAFFTAAMGVSFYVGHQNLNHQERAETELLKSGIVYPPTYKPLRPALMISAAIFGAAGIGALGWGITLPEGIELKDYASDAKETLSLLGTSIIGLSGFGVLEVCSSYFKDQIMTPPTKKKSLKNYFSEKFSLKEEKFLVPENK